MVDTETIRNSVRIRDIIERDLGRPVSRTNKYDIYKCPLHHETKGASLSVHEDGFWKCFGACNRGGDVIAWMMEHHGMRFNEAVHALGGNMDRTSPKPPPPRQETPYGPPGADWQQYATQLVSNAQEYLWSDAGKPAMDYLMEKRGLWPDLIEEWCLGYVPGSHDEWRMFDPNWRKPDGKTVRVPCGIIIPHIVDNEVWAVRSRRAAGPQKYQAVPGGIRTLYGATEIYAGWPVMLTEGEFDAMIVDQCAGDLVRPISLCSASNFRIHRCWWARLASTSAIYARLDDDAAGKSAAMELSKLSSAVRLIQVPEVKDINDLYLARGFRGVRQWIKSELGVAA